MRRLQSIPTPTHNARQRTPPTVHTTMTTICIVGVSRGLTVGAGDGAGLGAAVGVASYTTGTRLAASAEANWGDAACSAAVMPVDRTYNSCSCATR